MRIGEIAKNADVTVRTLQYYDKEGLLSPSGESEGGFRLYTDKDMVKLLQILMMKELGFSLKDIKKRQPSMDTSKDVVNVLTEQANVIRKKIEILSKSLESLEALKEEVAQMDSVDYRRYASILVSLQQKNVNYWMIKYLDDDLLEMLAESMSTEEAAKIADATSRFYDEAYNLDKNGILPESQKGQELAKGFWELLMEITKGDFRLLQKLNEHMDKLEKAAANQSESYKIASNFIKSAVGFYMNQHNQHTKTKKEMNK